MAYIILTANGDEIDRRELTASVTVGRAQDCNIPIRDILLSRKHCRIEPATDGHWVITDLGSKNGTYLGNQLIARHQLADGDELRLGRTHVTFRAGSFEPAPPGTRKRDFVRPMDPTEALSGTVAGFVLVEPGEVERQAGAPIPQPRPPEPTSYADEDVYGMLSEIASSSWDSIMAQASRPLVMERPLPRPNAAAKALRVVSRPRVAFCLQAPAAEAMTTTSEPAASPSPAEPAQHLPRRRRRQGTRWWNLSPRQQRQLVLGILSATATTLLVGAWIVAVNQGPQSSIAAPVQRPATVDTKPPTQASHDLADITFPTISSDPTLPVGTSIAPIDATRLPSLQNAVLRVAALHALSCI